MLSAGRIALLSILLTSGCSGPAKPPAATSPPRNHPPTNISTPALPPYDLLVRRGTSELQTNMAFQESAFKISQAAWDVDQQRGLIRFQSPDGVIAIAPVQILGTYNLAEGTWLWAWDNPSVAAALAQQASGMRAFGQKNSLPELTTASLTCDEAHCWNFIAAAAAMHHAQGAYRGMSGDTAVFMTFGTLTLSKSN